jgi:hypothetical protein
VLSRRYDCRACSAILVVVPRSVAKGRRYTLGAIAWALSLWAHERAAAATVRARTSAARFVGAAAPSRWASLGRWTRDALELFGFQLKVQGTLRECAGRVASFVAGHALLPGGPVSQDAFFGAAYCASS